MKINHKIKAFTLAEALILLLIVSLIAAALVPVITRKHKEVAAHGKWICTMDANGNHVIKTIIDGKDSGYKKTNSSSCTFTPPANAKNFKLIAVGGGGGGAGGKSGSEDVVFDSRGGDDSYAGNVTKEGTYTIVGVGGGGAGGGMGCGEAKNHVATHSFENHDCNASSYNDDTWDMTNQIKIDSNKWQGCNINNPDGEKQKFGYVDIAWPEWQNQGNYEKLYQNKEEFTDKYKNNKTNYNPEFKKDYLSNFTYEDFQNRIGCFAEPSPYTPNLSETPSMNASGKYGLYYQGKGNYSSIKCWNLPGSGGHSGNSVSSSNKSIKAGSSIYVTVGRAGEGQKLNNTERVGLYAPDNTKKTKVVYAGDEGKSGTDTVINIGGENLNARGGAGGYARQLVNVTYKDIPVYECPVIETTGTFTDQTGCPSGQHQSASACNSPKGCHARFNDPCTHYNYNATCTSSRYVGRDENGKAIWEPYSYTCTKCDEWNNPHYTCYSNSHTGEKFEVDYNKCVKKIRRSYFSIPACINSNSQRPKEYPDYSKADYPYLVTPFTTLAIEHLENISTTMDFGDYGSGGYGVGEMSKTYIVPTSAGNYDFILYGQPGMEGYAYISRVSYTGGGGGQAGSYISTMMKKIDKLKIVVGAIGAPAAQNSGVAGSKGGDTIIYKSDGTVLFTLKGGIGGNPDSTKAEYAAGRVLGVNGAPSPMENISNKARVIPFGGYQGNNTSIHGQTPLTEASKMTGSGNFTGGEPLDITYGAGGGGGAATKSQAGNGGVGAPGAVIIEW